MRHETTYESGLSEVAGKPHAGGRTLVLFLGSNIGNFDRPGAEEFLRTIRAALQPGDNLLLGADLVKPEADLLLAYDDPLGVTAAFNRNLLVRINRELGGDFDLEAFAPPGRLERATTRAWRCISSAGGGSGCASRRRTSTSTWTKGKRSGRRAPTNIEPEELATLLGQRRVSTDRALDGRRSALRAHCWSGPTDARRQVDAQRKFRVPLSLSRHPLSFRITYEHEFRFSCDRCVR